MVSMIWLVLSKMQELLTVSWSMVNGLGLRKCLPEIKWLLEYEIKSLISQHATRNKVSLMSTV